MVGRVRGLDGRRFHPDRKIWTAAPTQNNIESLRKWGFKITDQTANQPSISSSAPSIQFPKDLEEKLYPFQKEGVAFLESRKGRALIADEMGLGKTVQTLAWLRIHPELRPVMIVCPNSVKWNWGREASQWLPGETITVLSGKNGKELSPSQIFISNYDILAAWLPQLQSAGIKVLVVDETHYVKNRNAKRTKAFQALAAKIPHTIGLSGTPIVNRPLEGYTILSVLSPSGFGHFFSYAKRYCGARQTRFGWDFSRATNTDELYWILTSTVMIRRKKENVLKDLPEKVRSILPMDLADRKNYAMAEYNFRQWLRENGKDASKVNVLSQIEALKQEAVRGKLDEAIQWIRDFIEVDGKLVVFAHHRFVIDRLMNEFSEKAVKIDGSTPSPERQAAVDRFQNDPQIKIFIGNITAAGTGITLTAASNVAFLELPWTPGELNQAEDRCHRIGQKSSVTIYYLLAKHTIEEKIAALLDRKRSILSKVLDGADVQPDELLTELIREYYEEE